MPTFDIAHIRVTWVKHWFIGNDVRYHMWYDLMWFHSISYDDIYEMLVIMSTFDIAHFVHCFYGDYLGFVLPVTKGECIDTSFPVSVGSYFSVFEECISYRALSKIPCVFVWFIYNHENGNRSGSKICLHIWDIWHEEHCIQSVWRKNEWEFLVLSGVNILDKDLNWWIMMLIRFKDDIKQMAFVLMPLFFCFWRTLHWTIVETPQNSTL